MPDLTISTSVPQFGDTARSLLARMLTRLPAGANDVATVGNIVALASASRTTSTTSTVIDTRGYKGVAVVIIWTTTDATLTIDLQVRGAVGAAANDIALMPSGPLSVAATGRRTLQMYPGNRTNSTTEGIIQAGALLPQIVFQVTHSSANPITYEVRYTLIP